MSQELKLNESILIEFLSQVAEDTGLPFQSLLQQIATNTTLQHEFKRFKHNLLATIKQELHAQEPKTRYQITTEQQAVFNNH